MADHDDTSVSVISSLSMCMNIDTYCYMTTDITLPLRLNLQLSHQAVNDRLKPRRRSLA